MTGPRGGVIGVVKEQAIRSLVTHMSVRFETRQDDPGSWASSSAARDSRGGRPRSSSCWCRGTSRRRADRRGAARQDGDEHQAQEPGDVEVEPIGQPELRRDQDSRAQGGRPGGVTAARDEPRTTPSTTARRTGPRITACRPSPGSQIEKGARAPPGSSACGRGTRPAPEASTSPAHGALAAAKRCGEAQRAPAHVGGKGWRERDGPNLAQPASATSTPQHRRRRGGQRRWRAPRRGRRCRSC